MGKRSRRKRERVGSATPSRAPALQGSSSVPPPHGRLQADPFVTAIAAGDLDHELDRIGGVVSERRALLRAADTMAVMANLRVGDRVSINGSVRPKYMHGACGTVTGWAGPRVVVRLDHPTGRFGGELRCPPSVLEPLRH